MRLSHPLIGLFLLIMTVVSVTIYFLMLRAQEKLISNQAISLAESVASQASKNRNRNIAINARPTHVTEHIGSELYRYRPLSKWNLDEKQAVVDDFQRWAWQQLEMQDRADPEKAIDWQPVWRFESIGGVMTLRYLKAEPAINPSCVNCHNLYEQQPNIMALRGAAAGVAPIAPNKQYKLHQLIGAIEVNVPIDKHKHIADEQARFSLAVVIAISLIGLVVFGGLAWRDSRTKELAATLYAHRAKIDPLTELSNRTWFMEQADQQLKRAERERLGVGVLFIDLDNFKNINDSLGHAVGDLLLKAVAERLKQAVRDSGMVARLGGDEFTVLLPNLRSAESAARVARKLLLMLARRFMLGDQELYTSASIGISYYPRDGANAQTLLRNADAAMYKAKESGRNRYQFFSPEMNIQVMETLAMTNSLRPALERKEFVLYYQPRIDARSNKITAVEALLRWRHAELGLLPPDRFIALAEDTGMIEPIGEWVLKAACEQLRVWRESGIALRQIAVNLSARQLRLSNLLVRITAILQETGIDPGSLELEITESMVMRSVREAENMLIELNKLGIALAIDDFGIGHSSLSYLKRFPIDYLKIDKSFIEGIPNNASDCAITTAIITMAKSLAIRVVAEGVESEAQRKFLLEQDCDEWQGYLFCSPLPVQEMTALLRQVLR